MEYAINAQITPAAALKLLVMNEIAVDGYWPNKQAETLLSEIESTPISEYLKVIDFMPPVEYVNSATLPQFGSLEMLIRVPDILVATGMDGLSYTQLGFFLKEDVSAKQSANAKYGETHGKGACQLGFTVCNNSKVHFGALTNAFCAISDDAVKLHIAKLLCFRIPIIQTLLNYARTGKINGFDPMAHLEKSTQNRRGICVKMILRELRTLQDSELLRRIDNIYWDIDREANCNVEI